MCYISEQYISIIHLVHYSATLEKTVMSSSSSVQFSDNADRSIILLKKGKTTATGFKQVFFFQWQNYWQDDGPNVSFSAFSFR